MKKTKIVLLIIVSLISLSSFSQSLTNKTIEELEIMKKEAISSENYDLANKISEEQKTRISLDDKLKELNNDLKIAVANEHFEEAEKLKNEIKKLEEKKATINRLEEEKKAAILIEDFDKVLALEKQINELKRVKTAVEEKPLPTTPITTESKQGLLIEQTLVSKQKTENNSYNTDFDFFKKGFYMDVMAGVAFASYYGAGPGVGFRIGNKWYFGSNENYRIGIQAAWTKVGLYILDEELAIHLSPVNVGLLNLIKLSENTGIEANLTLGFNLMVFPDDEEIYMGFITNPSVKFRYKKLAMGLDYSISSLGGGDSYEGSSYSNSSITIGILSATFGLSF
jgi:TolA-binding protein